MAFEIVGVRAVIENLQGYIGGARQVEAATGRMTRAVDHADASSAKLTKFGGSLQRVSEIAGGFLAAQAVTRGVELLTSGLTGSVQKASDLAESMSKVQVVFAENAAEVEKWAKGSATAFGQSTQQALEAAGTYGNLFQAFGVGRREATDMSTSLVELAADLASFNNTSVDDALIALRSGLSGETEPLKRFGVAINDVRLREEALRLGLIKTTKDALTPGIKAQAAYALIMHDTALAQGDFGRTSTGLANSQRILKASIANVQAEFGKRLIPAVTTLVRFLAASVVPGVLKLVDALGPKLDAAGQRAAPVLRKIGEFVRTLGQYLRFVAEDGDLLNDFLRNLPPRAQPVAVALGIIVEIAKEVVRQLVSLARFAGDVASVLGRLTDAIGKVLPGGRSLSDAMIKIGGSETAVKGAAAGVTLLVAAMVVKTVADFAVGLGNVALQFALWPLQRARDIVGSILDLGRAVLGVPSRKVLEEVGAAGGAAGDCVSKTVECTQHVKHTGDKPITSDPITQEVRQNVKVAEVKEPKALAQNLGVKLATGIAQGVGAALGGALVVAVGAAIVAAGIPIAVVAIALGLVLALAIAGYFAYKFRGEIAGFFTKTLPAFLKGPVTDAGRKIGDLLLEGLRRLPAAAGFIIGAMVATIINLSIGIPLRIAAALVRAAPGLAKAGLALARALISGLELGVRELPGILGQAAVEGFQGLLRGLEFLQVELPRLVFGAARSAALRIPEALKDAPGFFLDLVTTAARVLASLPGVVASAIGGLAGEVARLFAGMARAVLDSPFGRAGAEVVAQFVEGFRRGFATVDQLTGGMAGKIAAIPGRLIAFVPAFLDAGSRLGSAIFDGLMRGLRAAPGLAGAFVTGIKEAVQRAINTAIDAINNAIPNSLPFKIRGVGFDIDLPDNPLPRVALQSGAGSFAGGAALLGELGPEVAFLPRGTEVLPADRSSALLRALASLVSIMPARPQFAGSTVGVTVPVQVTIQEMDWAAVRRESHRQLDTALTEARSRRVRAGAPISSSIG